MTSLFTLCTSSHLPLPPSLDLRSPLHLFDATDWSALHHGRKLLVILVDKMPKYVRRQPLSERIAAYLNPYDFLLWLSEEIESRGYDQLEKEWALPLGLLCNIVFLIARANTATRSSSYDDVFGETSSFSWRAWLVRPH